ncbi:MAG: riboflavin biosynthesis protein RibF [Elusimicrobia bacterium]|nr:riboflavin biosynthesis protein RibF [Elusimicrobiota bacterium]
MGIYLTIGTFDGVHLGHQKIIRTTIAQSLKRGLKSVLIYFPIPPKFYFSGEYSDSLITLPQEREELFANFRIGEMKSLAFNSGLASMTPEIFLDEILLAGRRVQGICVGRDFAFGKDRSGNIEFLREQCMGRGIDLKVMSFVRHKGRKISSSLIRGFLKSGEIENAGKCLSRPYCVSGRVIKGSGIGRKLGFATANVDSDPLKILPPGVFAAKVGLGNETYFGVANVGRRPTISPFNKRLLLETHILDFSKMIYGRTLSVELLKRIRGEKKFSGTEFLQRQIIEDVRFARKYFAASSLSPNSSVGIREL